MRETFLVSSTTVVYCDRQILRFLSFKSNLTGFTIINQYYTVVLLIWVHLIAFLSVETENVSDLHSVSNI